MKIYLAGTKSIINNIDLEKNKINILESFYYIDDKFSSKIKKFNSFLLDSGAYTFINSNKNKNIKWEEYVDRYADFINKNDIKLFFELDIDKIIGYDNVLKLRERLEFKTGKQCIPVWHRSRGKEEYFNLCEKYPYIAVGGIAIGDIKKEEYKIFSYLIDEAHKKGAKIHGLGFTNLEGLTKYHFDSVDSTTWLYGGSVHGYIHKFTGKTIKKIRKGDNFRLKKDDNVNIHNFMEWVKFQQYAEVKL